jgi:hypothetical protein
MDLININKCYEIELNCFSLSVLQFKCAEVDGLAGSLHSGDDRGENPEVFGGFLESGRKLLPAVVRSAVNN